jgi:enterochelin esterase family protein
MNVKYLACFGVTVAWAFFIPVQAQAQLKDPAISPTVRADKTVVLALPAAQADSVKATGSFPAAPVAMEKDEDGVWQVKLGPLDPGVYFYSFEVDGVQMIDPSSRDIHLSLLPNTSRFIVPGDQPLFYEERDVARGTMHIHRHRSSTLGDYRSYYVYTPRQYTHSEIERFPVLYLLHGYTDTEASWRASGYIDVILDNLVSARKAVPMIVVMPFGYAPAQDGDGVGTWGDWFTRVTPRFERYVMRELVPLVDRAYRTQASAKGRAIAGVSMGGGQALSIGLDHSDTFAWIGAFSSAVSREFHGPLLQDADELNAELELLWIGCGKDDFFYEPNTKFIEGLQKSGVRHVAHIGEGGHSWPVWHGYIREFAGLLFKDER